MPNKADEPKEGSASTPEGAENLLKAIGDIDTYNKFVSKDQHKFEETRNGALAKPIEHASYTEAGRIDTPNNFTEVIEFDRQKSYVKCDTERLTITLVTNMDNSMKSNIEGQLHFHLDLKPWQINEGNAFTAEELGQLCRRDYRMFNGDRETQKALVATLRNLKAKVTADLDKRKDDRGNETDSYVRAVESNLPETIILTPRLFRGHEERVFIEVLLVIHPTGGRDIKISLESVELIEHTEVNGGVLMEDQAKAMRDKGFAVVYA